MKNQINYATNEEKILPITNIETGEKIKIYEILHLEDIVIDGRVEKWKDAHALMYHQVSDLGRLKFRLHGKHFIVPQYIGEDGYLYSHCFKDDGEGGIVVSITDLVISAFRPRTVDINNYKDLKFTVMSDETPVELERERKTRAALDRIMKDPGMSQLKKQFYLHIEPKFANKIGCVNFNGRHYDEVPEVEISNCILTYIRTLSGTADESIDPLDIPTVSETLIKYLDEIVDIYIKDTIYPTTVDVATNRMRVLGQINTIKNMLGCVDDFEDTGYHITDEQAKINFRIRF